MDEYEALVAKEAEAAAALRSIDRLVPAAVIAMVGGCLAVAVFHDAGLTPIAMLAITFGIATLAITSKRRAHVAVLRRELKALEPPPIPPARLLR